MVVALEYDEGAVATFHYSWEAPVFFKGLSWSRIVGRQGVITFESNGVVVLAHGRQNQVIFPGFADVAGYRAMFRDYVAALRTGRPAGLSAEAALEDLRLVEEAYATARVGSDVGDDQ